MNLRLCNERWKSFSVFSKVATIHGEMLDGFEVPANEVSVLLRLRRLLLSKSSANGWPPGWAGLPNFYQITCLEPNKAWYIDLPDFVYEWGVSCRRRSDSTNNVAPSVVTRLWVGFVPLLSNGLPQDFLLTLTEEIGYLLFNLQHLEDLYMVVYDGQLPPQLAGLRNMRDLYIEHFCLTGGLPPGWLPNWKGLDTLVIEPSSYAPSTYVGPSGGRCGVQGSIPASWTNAPSNITRLLLEQNNMEGQ